MILDLRPMQMTRLVGRARRKGMTRDILYTIQVLFRVVVIHIVAQNLELIPWSVIFETIAESALAILYQKAARW